MLECVREREKKKTHLQREHRIGMFQTTFLSCFSGIHVRLTHGACVCTHFSIAQPIPSPAMPQILLSCLGVPPTTSRHPFHRDKVSSPTSPSPGPPSPPSPTRRNPSKLLFEQKQGKASVYRPKLHVTKQPRLLSSGCLRAWLSDVTV